MLLDAGHAVFPLQKNIKFLPQVIEYPRISTYAVPVITGRHAFFCFFCH